MAREFGFCTVAELASRAAVGTHPVLFLGAGASVKSGIPASADMVRVALRWLAASRRNLHRDDTRITPSDVQQLLAEQEWFVPGTDPAAYFPQVIALLDQPRELRRDFLLEMISRATNPSSGYLDLARLIRRRIVSTVVTPNFDELVKIACGPGGGLITMSNGDEYRALTTAPRWPQLVYLHGQAEYYLDKNRNEEIDHLDPGLVDRLLPILRDHALIVVGYRGAERSVMHDLLLKNVQRADGFNHGIFWCVRGTSIDTQQLPDPLRALAGAVGPNLTFVSISDFDSLMAELRTAWEEQADRAPSVWLAQPQQTQTDDQRGESGGALPLDQQPAPCGDVDGFDWGWTTTLLTQYAAAMRWSVPDPPDRAWCERILVEARLAVRRDGALRPTNAGLMLLTRDGRHASPGAYTQVWLPGKPPEAVDGTLSEQLDVVMALLRAINRPLRVKGPRSRDQLPYPEDALKEVLANALVHRDYGSADPVRVTATSTSIRVENPGGLDESLLRRLLGSDYPPRPSAGVPTDLLQRRIAHGERGLGLTAYRNATLADVFAGIGLVDKRGSGLSDAYEAMRDAGGSLLVEVADDNSRFGVTLYRMPAKVDARTQTAQPITPRVRMFSNLLEVLEIPPVVWSAPTHLTRYPDPRLTPGVDDWPRGVFHGGRVHMFADLTDPTNPLRPWVVLSDIRVQNTAEFAAGPDGENRMANLLNEMVFHHIRRKRLWTVIDWNRKRVHFSCVGMKVRRLPYRARVKEAERKVAWWEGKENPHCVHKAAVLRAVRYGDTWALRINPTYVFTEDGLRKRVAPHRASALATSASTEDYNPKAQADVFFWRAVITGDVLTCTLDAGHGPSVVLSAMPASVEVETDPRH